MLHIEKIKLILGDTLGIQTRQLHSSSPLLGSVPELDSMAVLGVIAALEEQFDIAVDDDEINARHFATIGSLAAFVDGKREA
ncbi:MAG: phosphopantetheine-binding protein [Pseudomonadota bacterium]